MHNIGRKVLYGSIGLLALLWIAGELSYPHTNPQPVHSGPILGEAGDAILRRSCFDCHSNETRHPWYIRLPVAGLLIGYNIREGRGELNFSLWPEMGAQERRKALSESLESVLESEMPDLPYLWLHPDARLSQADLTVLEAEALRLYGAVPEHAGGGKGDDDDDDDHGGRDRD